MTAETEEGTGSVLSIARLPSPDPGQRAMAHPAGAPRLASLASPPPASSAKKIRLATLETPTLETPKGSSLSLDPDSRTAIYDIAARTVYMPDGRRPAMRPQVAGNEISAPFGKHTVRAYSAGRSPDWLKSKNPASPVVRREADEDWGISDLSNGA
jgi:hypothetical protein